MGKQNWGKWTQGYSITRHLVFRQLAGRKTWNIFFLLFIFLSFLTSSLFFCFFYEVAVICLQLTIFNEKSRNKYWMSTKLMYITHHHIILFKNGCYISSVSWKSKMQCDSAKKKTSFCYVKEKHSKMFGCIFSIECIFTWMSRDEEKRSV